MITRIFLALIALSIGTIGILYLYDPNILLARYELSAGSAGMDNMLRSTYGGLFLGSAFIFIAGVVLPSRQRDALIFVVIFMAGSALGRIMSMVAIGAPPSTIMPLLYLEITAALIAVALLARQPSAEL